jgi:hypothetical protein
VGEEGIVGNVVTGHHDAAARPLILGRSQSPQIRKMAHVCPGLGTLLAGSMDRYVCTKHLSTNGIIHPALDTAAQFLRFSGSEFGASSPYSGVPDAAGQTRLM